MQPTAAISLTGQQGRLQGFIRPPPDIRAVVDKTAAFVARMGDDVEAKISGAEAGNLKFGFLRSDDPYHAYYKHKVAEGRGGGAAAAAEVVTAEAAATAASASASAAEGGATGSAAPPAAAAPLPAAPGATSEKRASALPSLMAKALKALAAGDASAPPPQREFTLPTPPYASAAEAETIKTTAQFTAAGGRPFLAALAAREEGNAAFAFLKPSHALFSFFTQHVDAYARLLSPAPATLQRLRDAARHPLPVLQRACARLEHARREEAQRAELAAGLDAARATIDWQDFVVVETIEFAEEELLEEEGGEGAGGEGEGAGAGSAGAGAGAGVGGAGDDSDGDDMDIDEGGGSSAAAAAASAAWEQGLGADGGGERLNIRRDYVPAPAPARAAAPTNFLHPVTGRQIPLEQASEHLRVELLDPKWREEQHKAAQKFVTTSYTDGSDMAANLRRLASSRTDIFGAPGGEGAGGGGAAAPPQKRSKN